MALLFSILLMNETYDILSFRIYCPYEEVALIENVGMTETF